MAIKPGATTFTVMPRTATSLANDFEKAILQNELKLMSVNQRLNYNVVNLDSSDFSEQNFINLNSPEDIQKANENKS